MYHVRILEAAARQLGRLDKPTGRRVAKRINRLAANLDVISLQALSGDLATLCAFTAG